jgi:hypothetical protein
MFKRNLGVVKMRGEYYKFWFTRSIWLTPQEMRTLQEIEQWGNTDGE